MSEEITVTTVHGLEERKDWRRECDGGEEENEEKR